MPRFSAKIERFGLLTPSAAIRPKRTERILRGRTPPLPKAIIRPSWTRPARPQRIPTPPRVWVTGWIFDVTGSYQAAFLNGIAWNVLNASIILALLWRTTRGFAAA